LINVDNEMPWSIVWVAKIFLLIKCIYVLLVR